MKMKQTSNAERRTSNIESKSFKFDVGRWTLGVRRFPIFL